MYGIKRYLRVGSLLIVASTALLLAVLRYLLKTPQQLESVLPGASRLYKWAHGYIFYKVSGPLNAPALVFFHRPGLGASSYEMRAMMDALAERYRVYALDLLGFGLSDHPEIIYTSDIYIQLYRDFLVDVVGRPARLCASGLSCNYCISLAAREPELCEQLILLLPEFLKAKHIKQSLLQWLVQLLKSPLPGLVLYAVLTSRVVLRGIVAWQYGLKYTQVSRGQLDYISAAAHQFGAQRAVLALLTGTLAIDVVYLIEKLQIPILLAWNEEQIIVQLNKQIA